MRVHERVTLSCPFPLPPLYFFVVLSEGAVWSPIRWTCCSPGASVYLTQALSDPSSAGVLRTSAFTPPVALSPGVGRETPYLGRARRSWPRSGTSHGSVANLVLSTNQTNHSVNCVCTGACSVFVRPSFGSWAFAVWPLFSPSVGVRLAGLRGPFGADPWRFPRPRPSIWDCGAVVGLQSLLPALCAPPSARSVSLSPGLRRAVASP